MNENNKLTRREVVVGIGVTVAAVALSPAAAIAWTKEAGKSPLNWKKFLAK
jgi:hypothetical protein